VKFALAIVCSLLLVLGQAVAWSMPVSCAGAAENNCGCGGQMPCCKTAAAPAPQPLAATAPLGSQNQMLSPVPVAVVWVSPAAETTSISPTVSPSLTAAVTPLFARHCVRLL
jgi:hypothetical protein